MNAYPGPHSVLAKVLKVTHAYPTCQAAPRGDTLTSRWHTTSSRSLVREWDIVQRHQGKGAYQSTKLRHRDAALQLTQAIR